MSSAEESPRKIRTFIYGSCVSRDTFEFLPQDKYELVGYVARQSLIGFDRPAFVDPARWVARLESDFQRRMFEGDIKASLRPTLEKLADSIDVLLWDIADERLGINEYRDGGVTTRSLESIKSGYEESVAGQARFVEFGSARHIRLWTDRLREFGEFLLATGLASRTVVLKVPWAADIDGAGAPLTSFGIDAHTANRRYQRYYRAIRKLGLAEVHLSKGEVDVGWEHRWGPAPFHYDDETYRRVVARIALISDGQRE